MTWRAIARYRSSALCAVGARLARAHRVLAQVFKETVEGMFQLIGRENPKAEAEMVFALEHSLAQIQVWRPGSFGLLFEPGAPSLVEAARVWLVGGGGGGWGGAGRGLGRKLALADGLVVRLG